MKDPEMICVRARVTGDISRAFKGTVQETVSEPGRDYAFRAWVTREQLKNALNNVVDNLHYTNFKDSVEEEDRHDAYLDIWGNMYDFQRKRMRKPTEK